ncbi:MAG: nucleotide exchange factor GrpE, partial [Thiotrichaceae bacterium]|nr:nucleotide exchange factor GrpE [Thiotrichaceae bacterium]
LDIYDRLEAGMSALNNYTPPLFGYFYKREINLILGLQKGQAMTLRRVIQILARYRVRPLEVLEKPLDPHCMRAVEVDSQQDIKNGIVTGELRKGFMWEDDVLRPAEVKVNKR